MAVEESKSNVAPILGAIAAIITAIAAFFAATHHDTSKPSDARPAVTAAAPGDQSFPNEPSRKSDSGAAAQTSEDVSVIVHPANSPAKAIDTADIAGFWHPVGSDEPVNLYIQPGDKVAGFFQSACPDHTRVVIDSGTWDGRFLKLNYKEVGTKKHITSKLFYDGATLTGGVFGSSDLADQGAMKRGPISAPTCD